MFKTIIKNYGRQRDKNSHYEYLTFSNTMPYEVFIHSGSNSLERKGHGEVHLYPKRHFGQNVKFPAGGQQIGYIFDRQPPLWRLENRFFSGELFKKNKNKNNDRNIFEYCRKLNFLFSF